MNSRKSLFRQFFSIQIFGFVLGGGVFAVFLLLSLFTQVPNRLETRILDIHFTLKRSSIRSREQENVVVERHSPKISRDILIVGIDSRTLNVLGSWPFPRSSHADLLNSFARIQNQNEREAVILLDFLFTEKALDPTEDAALVEAIKGNGRVALQSQVFGLPLVSARENDHNNRLSVLLDRLGNISNVRGNTNKVVAYYGIESPLVPLGETIAAHGHASFRDDFDAVYRRQQIVIRYGQKIGEISLDELTADTKLNFKNNKGHLAWVKKTGQIQPMVFPLTSEELALVKKKIRRYGAPRIDSSGTASWYLTIYQDYYIPAITLSLALRYFNRTLDEVEVVYGSHIRIPEPLKWNAKTSQWEPYSIRGKQLNEIKIPIDENGSMRINFMGVRSSPTPGGIQTYPVRSYAAYSQSVPDPAPEKWPKTRKLNSKIIMVGAFSSGMADDEKITPLGLMYGVEIHTNALNTIIMNNFIRQPSRWVNSVIMLILIMLFTQLSSRMHRIIWPIIILLAFVAISFFSVNLLFEYQDYLLDWANPILAILCTYVIITVYRVFIAERDKKLIKNVFGQFISPAIVEDLSETPPKLGGENIDITVFFSDIRSFTRISEKMNVQDLVRLLNNYLTEMTDTLINEFDGTLDKYIGDAIMAFWGAPRLQEDHAVKACKCAINQLRLLKGLNERLKAMTGDSFSPIDIGIGLHSGKCMVGYVGSEGRKSYTAIGDAVNLASRIEGVNKSYLTNILISEATWNKVKHEPFIARDIDCIRVKGRNKPVTIFELIDYDGKLL